MDPQNPLSSPKIQLTLLQLVEPPKESLEPPQEPQNLPKNPVKCPHQTLQHPTQLPKPTEPTLH